MSIAHILGVFALGLAGLFPIVNPFGTIPLFLALTGGMSNREREKIARRSSIWAGAIMLTFFFVGTLILSSLGISLDAVRAAGGLIITFIGFRMLFEFAGAPSHNSSDTDHGKIDPSLVPLAMPSMSGPGTLSVIMTGSAQIAQLEKWSEKIVDYIVVVLIVLTVAAACYLVLRASIRISRTLGSGGLDALKKIMGFLLICLGVQFFANGCIGFVNNAGHPTVRPPAIIRTAP